MEHGAPLQRISKFLRGIGEATSKASAAIAVALVLLVFLLILGIEGFPTTWLTTFAAIADIVTLIMLFIIQHTQSRHQLVLQLKLDELIRSSPLADDRAVKLEVAPDDELVEREKEQLAHHESLREPDTDD
ncbi:MAG: low affinity iron permease family protein [Acidimicrobiales bacterium]